MRISKLFPVQCYFSMWTLDIGKTTKEVDSFCMILFLWKLEEELMFSQGCWVSGNGKKSGHVDQGYNSHLYHCGFWLLEPWHPNDTSCSVIIRGDGHWGKGDTKTKYMYTNKRWLLFDVSSIHSITF